MNRVYKYGKDGYPFRYLGSEGKRADRMPTDELLEFIKDRYENFWPERTMDSPDVTPNELDVLIGDGWYINNRLRLGTDIPEDTAMELMTEILGRIHTYKDYYVMFAAMYTAFALGRKLTENRAYASKAFDELITFTKNKLFEIFLVDRKTYQQIIRAFYRTYGLKLRVNLPFVPYPRKLVALPGMWYSTDTRDRSEETSIAPFDPSPYVTEKVGKLAADSLHPDIFILPAFYIYTAVEKSEAGYKIEHIEEYKSYKIYLDAGVSCLHRNCLPSIPTPSVSKGEPRGHLKDYQFFRGEIIEATGQFSALGNPKSKKPYHRWFGLAYFLADTEGRYDLKTEIAALAMENPAIKEYTGREADVIYSGHDKWHEQHVKEERTEIITAIVKISLLIIGVVALISFIVYKIVTAEPYVKLLLFFLSPFIVDVILGMFVGPSKTRVNTNYDMKMFYNISSGRMEWGFFL